MNVFVLMFWEH